MGTRKTNRTVPGSLETHIMTWLARFGLLLLLVLPCTASAEEQAKMKFNDVREVAPGVFFRYSAISPTDQSVFGGSNNIWVVFEDYVVVIDANFPKEAAEVIEAVKKTTDKPIRYVFDTHHHGDHAYGNAVFASHGASIISQANCARLLRLPQAEIDFKEAGRGPTGRKDIATSRLKAPSIVFDDKLVLDDGKQRIEFLYFGHSHTIGDASAYLPRHKILCTGDACLNGPYNYMGHSDSASWISCLEKMQQLDIKLICPGHGPLAGKDLLAKQRRYFVELRQQVQAGLDANKSAEDIAKSIDMPWYKEWTTKDAKDNGDNIKHVMAELSGTITPADLIDDFGIVTGPSPSKVDPGWTKPRRIVVPSFMPAKLAELKRVAPDIEFITVKTPEDAAKAAVDADAVLEFCTPEVFKAAKSLRWIGIGHTGVEAELFPELIGSQVTVTNTKRLFAPPVADTGFALLLSLTRGLRQVLPVMVNEAAWRYPEFNQTELHGQTMLVIGLGGIGTNVARRAHAFGMRVMAIDPQDMERPSFVFSLDKPAKLMDLIPKADVVMICCPLTPETKGMIGAKQFAVMKKSAYFVNIARGGIVKTDDLLDALRKKTIAGAGVDVAEPEPLPMGHPLLKEPNFVMTPHIGAVCPGTDDRAWRLHRENVRRFAVGEPLLCVVDKSKGY
jgi:phosphoglycerate dehydrogenase-like enzyme/glyoxylase-like metal-dependent hydrolase (beta-lactamase superfamily II)